MKVMRWITINGFFLGCLVAGLVYDVQGALNIGIFATWALLLFSCAYARTDLLTKLAKSYKWPDVPAWLDALFDCAVLALLVWHGRWYSGAAYLAHFIIVQSSFIRIKAMREGASDNAKENQEVEALRANVQRLKAELESANSRPPMNPHFAAIAYALQHAKRKHPFFAHFPMEKWLPRQTSEALAEARVNLADMISINAVTGSDVLECEIAEARDDYSRGDFSACLEELAQCGAVLVRMMEAVQELADETAKAGKAGEEPK